MAYRTGQVAKINVGFLAEGQEWVEDQLTGDAHIEGLPKSNKPIGYFAYLKTFSGREHSLYMTNDEINAHKEKYAQGYDRARSAWNTDFHKMAKKTVLSQLLKAWAPLDPTGTAVATLEYTADAIDEMPEPGQVTIINPAEARDNDVILAELGFEQAPKKQAMPKDTGGPGDWSEFWSNVKEGNYPGVTEEIAGDFVKATNSVLSEVWKLTKQHIADHKLEMQQEALL
jgi:recombinational DNA repair protein RecT